MLPFLYAHVHICNSLLFMKIFSFRFIFFFFPVNVVDRSTYIVFIGNTSSSNCGWSDWVRKDHSWVIKCNKSWSYLSVFLFFFFQVHCRCCLLFVVVIIVVCLFVCVLVICFYMFVCLFVCLFIVVLGKRGWCFCLISFWKKKKRNSPVSRWSRMV